MNPYRRITRKERIRFTQELEAISQLNKDQYAKIIHKAEVGHYESNCVPANRWGGYDWVEEWTIDEPEISDPDTPKREMATKLLREKWEHSPWYSIRWQAGLALSVSNFGESGRSWVSPLTTVLLSANPQITSLQDAQYFLPHRWFISDALRHSLQTAYDQSDNAQTRITAGKLLRHSQFKVWWDESRKKKRGAASPLAT